MLKLEERIRKYEPLFGQWYLGKKIELLGRGNSGTVFAIHKDQYDQAHKRVIATLDYALKVVPIPRNDDHLNELRNKCHSEEEVRRQLTAEKELAQKEIDIMERLWSANSDNIVFFENNHIREREDTFGWDVLICMERLERLDKLLENYRAYKVDKPGYELYMRIWSELLDGLRACESQNIVHLDIKPENIFYGPPGVNRFKLGDFGVSARTETGGLAEKGMRVGTIEYMAPEVYNGAGGDTRSDMYSLALVIYKLLNNGRLPFQRDESRTDIIRASKIRIEGNTPIPPINGVDYATMCILFKCLEPDPRNRYQTVAECKQALMQINGSVKKRRKLMPALIAGAAVLVAGAAAFVGVTMFGGSGSKSAVSVDTYVTDLPAEDMVTVTPEAEMAVSAEPTECPTAEPTEEPTAEPTEEPTAEPTEEPTEEPTAEPTEEPVPPRKEIQVSYGFESPADWAQPEGHVPGDFRVQLNGEPGEQIKVQISCSFLKDVEEMEMQIDENGNSEIERSYESEGRVKVRVWYSDQSQSDAAEIILMVDGKAPELLIGEVTEGAQMLTGKSEAGAGIELSAQGIKLSTSAGADGQFMLPMHDYSAGIMYTLTATDASGNSAVLTFQPEKAELVYDPARNVPVTNVKKSTNAGGSMVTVTASGNGYTGREIAVFVNGVHQINVKPGNDGKWVATMMMPAMDNELDIKAMYIY